MKTCALRHLIDVKQHVFQVVNREIWYRKKKKRTQCYVRTHALICCMQCILSYTISVWLYSSW